MTKGDLISYWAQAIEEGTFLTAKHDPSGVGVTWTTFRSVLSPEVAQNLSGIIQSGNFSVEDYRDTRTDVAEHQNNQYVLNLGDSGFDVPGSGIAPNTPQPNSACDRLVALSGHEQGWHIYADSASRIGTLKYLSFEGEIE